MSTLIEDRDERERAASLKQMVGSLRQCGAGLPLLDAAALALLETEEADEELASGCLSVGVAWHGGLAESPTLT